MESVDLFVRMSPKGSLFNFCVLVCRFDDVGSGDGGVEVEGEEKWLVVSLPCDCFKLSYVVD